MAPGCHGWLTFSLTRRGSVGIHDDEVMAPGFSEHRIGRVDIVLGRSPRGSPNNDICVGWPLAWRTSGADCAYGYESMIGCSCASTMMYRRIVRPRLLSSRGHMSGFVRRQWTFRLSAADIRCAKSGAVFYVYSVQAVFAPCCRLIISRYWIMGMPARTTPLVYQSLSLPPKHAQPSVYTDETPLPALAAVTAEIHR